MEDERQRTDPVLAMDTLVARLTTVLTGGGTAAGVETTGYGADGRIAARLAPDGHVAALTIEPVLARAAHDEVIAGIVTAVNDAVDARPADAGTASLLPELRAIKDESVELTKSMNASLLTALDQLKASQ